MKKIISILIVFCIVVSSVTVVFAADKQNRPENEKYVKKLSKMINTYRSDDYFSTMSVTIGKKDLIIDGKAVPIDESGSTAYVENGRTMMPVRGIAEAIGAEISFDKATQTVTVENEDTTIAMTIGDNEMKVNNKRVRLLSAPKIKDNRTMLPIRDVAEALDCEVKWDQNSQTAIFTREYQTKRIIVNSEYADTSNSVAHFSADGKTVIQFDSIEKAKKSVELNTNKGFIAEPDFIRKSHAMSWGIDTIGSQKYYSEVDYASGSATVAVIDTGIDLSHSYFNGKLVQGYDLADNDNTPQDTVGHGTHVASTVLDVAGFNPQIKVMPVKVFEDGSEYAYSSTIALGIEYAVNYGADVINLSVGGEHSSDIEQQAVNKAYRNNVAVIAAAGNEELNLDNTNYVPAGLDHVITVSAMNKDGTLATFSNYGRTKLEFTAPGVDIKGAKLGGGYCTMDGTSMASPHVAGAYAIVMAAHPEASVDEITEALGKNADNKGNSNYFGYGLIKVNSLERHLSTVWCDNVKVENVSETSARFSGTVKYSGIAPEYVGARLGTTRDNQNDVYTVHFSENRNNTMDFSCELDSLKSGTTYYVRLFMKSGGSDYASENIEFTTNKAPIIIIPEPEPVKSELRILPNEYPQGNIKEGSSFRLSGRIKSNYHITDVRSYILDSNKNVLQESSGWTTTQTYVIENSNLDTGLKFGRLNAGTYYLKYYAEDETGNKVSWISEAFKVVEEKKPEPIPVPDPVPSDLRIIPDAYPSGQLSQGSTYGLSGRIKSNYHITDVRAYLLDANKNTIMEASGWTTTQTYVIENSALDKGMKFNQLPAGTYYLKYVASDESGNTVSWISNAFTVVSNKPSSELRILPESYPSGTLKRGKSFGLSGRIKSNCHITDVRAYLLDANGNIVMEASGWTTTQTYVIEGSALDKGMKFNNLSTGGYYLKYTAADESGNTVNWISEKFYIE